MIAALGLLLGIIAGLVFAPDVPLSLQNYLPIAVVAALELVPESAFTTEAVQAALSSALVDELGLKPRVAYGPPRVALTGRRVSPPLFESMELLGKADTLRRLGGQS